MVKDSVFKKQNIIRVLPDDTLSQTFSLFSSSSDAAFVFDEKQRFLGVVSPYYCLIKKSYPSNTKVKHCLIHPPRIDKNFSLRKVIQLMIDTKIYYLPVFSGENFFAVISAKRIIAAIADSKELQIPISTYLKHRSSLISIFEDDFISKALALFKRYRIFRLAVLSKDLKLKGVLSYFDLICYLIVPKEKQHFTSREGVKTPFLKRYVKTIMKSAITTLPENERFSTAANLIIRKNIGSIIILNRERHPVGIITKRDLLSVFVGRHKFMRVKLITKGLSQTSFNIVSQFVKHINQQLTRFRTVSKVKFFIKENSNIFSAILSFFSKNKQTKVIKKEDRDLNKVLHEIGKKAKVLKNKFFKNPFN